MTVHADVVVIALYSFWDLDLEELWIESAEGKTVSGWQCMLRLKPLERRYAALYFSGMPSQAVVLCSSSLEKEKKNSMENLGKISKGNRDVYQTFVRIKISRIRHQDYREYCCPHLCFMSPYMIAGSTRSPS